MRATVRMIPVFLVSLAISTIGYGSGGGSTDLGQNKEDAGEDAGTGPDAGAREPAKAVRIGVLNECQMEICLEKWGPTAEYLTQEIPGYAFSIVPLVYTGGLTVSNQNTLDFLLTNPAKYVEFAYTAKAKRIATLVNLSTATNRKATVLGGVVFTRADNQDIFDFKDLKGKSFMAPHENSFAGWNAVQCELREHGLDTPDDFAEMRFGGHHESVVYAVRDGKADAGSVKSGTMERMAMKGTVRMEDFRVIEGTHSPKDKVPFLHSTPHYPEWPMSSLPHTSEILTKRVAITLLNMPPDSQAAISANCAGWTVPLNYQPVRDCMKTLHIGSYKDYGKVTLQAVLQQYRDWFIVGGVLLVISALFFLIMMIVNRKLKFVMKAKDLELYRRLKADQRNVFLSSVVEQSSEGMVIADLKGIMLFVNNAWKKMHGYESKEDLLGRNLSIFHTEAQLRDHVETFNRDVMKKGLHSGEVGHMRADGSVFRTFMTTSILKDPEGNPSGIVGIAMDITERRKAEKKLVASERQFRRLFEDVPIPLWEGDFSDVLAYLEGLSYREIEDFDEYLVQHPEVTEACAERVRITAVNKALIELHEAVTAEELMSGFSRTFIEPGFHAFREQLVAFWQGKLLHESETKIATLSGEARQVMIRWSVPPDHRQTLSRVFVAMTDLTEKKKMAEKQALMEHQMRHQQKLESIGTLAAGVAHEINNPVNIVSNFAELILDEVEKDGQAAKHVEGILNASDRIATIVRNLLAFSRQDKESHSPALVPDIVDGTVSLIRKVLKKEQITVEVTVADDLPMIKCRSQQIQQVLMNLLTNARDALNDRYPGYDVDKVVRVVAGDFEKDGARWIRITVENHGESIPDEVMRRLFEPFYTTKPRDVGTGLGLSVSYGIVKEHKGELTVESEEGGWTRFHVDLPVNNGWTLDN